MEESLKFLIEHLEGPAGAMLLLSAVLYACWKFINKVVDVVSRHLGNIELKFDKLISTLDSRASKIEEDLEEVQTDVQVLKEQTRHIVFLVEKEKRHV